MAPILLRRLLSGRDFDPLANAEAFAAQWTAPADVFNILLIIGGDVVQRALAQLSGGLVTPVAFSFGWVSYAISAVVSSLGENKLMPDADCPCIVINAKSGYVRDNSSWILGRLMRDYESWRGKVVEEKIEQILAEKWQQNKDAAEALEPGSGAAVEKPFQAGLCVSIWEPSHTQDAGKQGHDFLYWSSIAVIAVQLGIAAIPCGLYGDWGILMLTGAATLLSSLTGALSQWSIEKWACRRLNASSRKNFVVSRGNGAQHAILILSGGRGLDLEDLATGFQNLDSPAISKLTRAAVICIAFFWLVLLVTSSAIEDEGWFLIAVGGIGIVQNIIVSSISRNPAANGIPLDFIGVIGETKVMGSLMAVERKYEKAGKSMLDTFFPGNLRPKEEAEWEAIAEEWKVKKAGEEKKQK